MNFKKIATALLAGLMAVTCVLPLTACKKDPSAGGDTVVTQGEAKIKVLKMGRALASIIRTETSTVVIDTGDIDHTQDLIQYLTEKEIKTVDAVVLTNYSKKCIGGMPDLLASGITVKAVYGPTYQKDSSSYDQMANALASYKLTVETIGEQKDLTFGDGLVLTCYPAGKDYSTLEDENDEGNSMAIAMNFGSNSMLFPSRITGERLAELTTQIKGKDFDCIMAPNFGAYDDKLPAFLSEVKAESAVIVASNSNPPAEDTLKAMTSAGIEQAKIYATNNGSVEISVTGKSFTIKQ